REAALLVADQPYRDTTLDEIQHAIYAMGSFSTVNVEPILREGSSVVDVRIRVTPHDKPSFSFGTGIQSGLLDQVSETISVPQWDVHFLAAYEDKTFLDGLRRLRVEDRPRLIIQEPFPQWTTPRLGNLLKTEFVQAGFLEPRTELTNDNTWDYGPDPFDTFFRHQLGFHVGLRRRFLDQRVMLSGGVCEHIMVVPEGEERFDGTPAPADHHLTCLQEELTVDLRDDSNRPHGGAYAGVHFQQAGLQVLPSSWDYLRVVPELRGYIPLPYRITIASRIKLGVMEILGADSDLDTLSAQLGPRYYRLRGGGANSNRGFFPGELGDGPEGGLRRWELSVELRLPITETVGFVTFWDMGDVNRGKTFRLDHPQASVGGGLRVHTIAGAIRLDVGYRIADLQVIDGPDERILQSRSDVDLGFISFPGAIHITIGETY
ncbi:MAG: BamA/TamA family outer membrane protein, partial [Myxococcales bacterium]|nr:BamA/TamA family outer membrane protein [Myxococcales bacterium]